MKNSSKICLLVLCGMASFIAMLFVPPIVQDPAFHNFADGREIASIPNFWNVFSNVPLLVTGAAGLWMSVNSRPKDASRAPELTCVVFFTGIVLTGIGSAYYHLNPNDSTLIWDRLPMTITFMSFFSLLVEKTIHGDAGKKILLPALLVAGFSVFIWHWKNDLRLYVLVQFLPMIYTPLILFMFSAGRIKIYFWLVVAAYSAAKMFEATDVLLYSSLGISGHTIKHLFAALAPLFLLSAMKNKVL